MPLQMILLFPKPDCGKHENFWFRCGYLFIILNKSVDHHSFTGLKQRVTAKFIELFRANLTKTLPRVGENRNYINKLICLTPQQYQRPQLRLLTEDQHLRSPLKNQTKMVLSYYSPPTLFSGHITYPDPHHGLAIFLWGAVIGQTPKNNGHIIALK